VDAWHYVVLLGLVLLLYARWLPKSKSSAAQAPVIKEIEETMEQFSAELDEENRKLMQLVAAMKKDQDLHAAKLQGRIEALEQQNANVTRQLEQLLKSGSAPSVHAETGQRDAGGEDADRASAETANSDVREPEPSGGIRVRARYPDVFRLYDQGKSAEYIAKKLNMNKGEIMLIIQLAKQEELARV
jgi:hypothetical protein